MLHVVAVLLVAIAVVHVLWVLGVVWPARDREHLAMSVIGRRLAPGVAPTVIVVGGLLAMAWSLWTSTPGWSRYVIGGIFVLRGTVGFVEPAFRPEILGTPYARLSRLGYTPLALAIGLATLLGG